MGRKAGMTTETKVKITETRRLVDAGMKLTNALKRTGLAYGTWAKYSKTATKKDKVTRRAKRAPSADFLTAIMSSLTTDDKINILKSMYL